MEMDDKIHTRQREKDDNKDTHRAKKMKWQEEEISKSEDAANNMKQEEDIPKSQDGTNTVNFRDPECKEWYGIGLKLKDVRAHEASGGDSMSLYRKVMKDAGCSEFQIYEACCTPFCFVASLTPQEAQKMSDLDSVRGMERNRKLSLDTRRSVRLTSTWYVVASCCFGDC
ncbi:hypothetical protein POM88_036594 [Heracleum sosnowskyi]|uniref:Uncharacterized protein n=1 Tax=Heracleum sosnowskyi TaxID=360622 RepID=A0AAD8MF43_9APIA|nr:hypothetical protein POM88_036594 [Heracleum sosnowskyi]